MDKLPFSFTTHFLEIMSLTDVLQEAIVTANRANIVRACSNLMYCFADLLEQTIPDGCQVNIKINEDGNN